MGTLRPPNPLRGVRQAIEDREFNSSRTAVLEDEPHRQAIDQLLPQIQQEAQFAAKVTRATFLYYRRKNSGRRCSCFTGGETTPEGTCQICYGSGFVGGWDLHGCRTDIIDVTKPNLRLVGVFPNYDLRTRPVVFTLHEGALKGFIDADIEILRNIHQVEALQWFAGSRTVQNAINLFIKVESDTDFVPLTKESFAARLGNSLATIRVQLTRKSVRVESPRFSHLLLRYKLIPEIQFYGDVPLGEASFELGDLGYSDTYTTLTVYLPAPFDHLTTEDFMIRQSDQKRFKVTTTTRNAPLGILTSHTLTARILIPGRDPLVNFP